MLMFCPLAALQRSGRFKEGSELTSDGVSEPLPIPSIVNASVQLQPAEPGIIWATTSDRICPVTGGLCSCMVGSHAQPDPALH